MQFIALHYFYKCVVSLRYVQEVPPHPPPFCIDLYALEQEKDLCIKKQRMLLSFQPSLGFTVQREMVFSL